MVTLLLFKILRLKIDPLTNKSIFLTECNLHQVISGGIELSDHESSARDTKI